LTAPPAKNINSPEAIQENPLLAVLDARSKSSSAALSFVKEIALHWRISPDDAVAYMEHAFRAGEKFGVDPLLVMAVISVESSWRPAVNSSSGAEGLMQVRRQSHPEKFERRGIATSDPLPPEVGISVGTEVLREYLDRAQRRRPATDSQPHAERAWLDTALLAYSGNKSNPTSVYPSKVKDAYVHLAGRMSALSGAQAVDADIVRSLRDGVRVAHASTAARSSSIR